jgi:hypothetical protein
MGNSSSIWPPLVKVPWNINEPNPIIATPIHDSLILHLVVVYVQVRMIDILIDR